MDDAATIRSNVGGADPAIRLGQAKGLLVRRTSDAVVVLGQGADATIMRSTAAEVWDAFAAPRAVDQVAELMAARYGVAGSDVCRDVLPFIEDLVAKELLIVHPPIASNTDRDGVSR